jgi:hypothetical protein
MKKRDQYASVKTNLNFLEYPLWFIDDKWAESKTSGWISPEAVDPRDRESALHQLKREGFVWVHKGFTYRSGYKPASTTDIKFLNTFMAICQQRGWPAELTVKRSEFFNACQISNPGTKNFMRLKDSLERWKNLTLKFENIFYKDTAYQTLSFGVLDDYSIDEQNVITIKFNRYFLAANRDKYSRKLRMDIYKFLRSEIAIRLCEILAKAFADAPLYRIPVMELGAKMQIKARYPSQVIDKVKRAVGEISKKYTHTEMSIALSVVRSGDEQLFLFERVTPPKEPKSDQDQLEQTAEEVMELIPARHAAKKTIRYAIEGACKKYGRRYAAWVVRRVNEESVPDRDYRARIIEALKTSFDDFAGA